MGCRRTSGLPPAAAAGGKRSAPASPPAPTPLCSQSHSLPTSESIGSHETPLSAYDVQTAATATVRAWGWRGARVDPAALEEAVRALASDLPFLAGRLRLRDSRLASTVIEHPPGAPGHGIRLAVVEAADVSVACMGPAAAWVRRGVTVQDPQAPWYVPQLNLSLK